MRFILILFCAALLIPVSRKVRASEELAWKCRGPWGGFIFRVRVDETNPDRVLAFTTGGNFLSIDAGSSWTRLPDHQESWLGWGMSFSEGRLWFVGEGILQSSADGKSWRPEGNMPGQLLGHAEIPGEPPASVRVSVQRDQPNPTSVHVLTPGRAARKIGEAPAKNNSGFQGNRFRAHAAAPGTLRIAVSIYEEGVTWVFGSEDSGDSWTRWSIPLRLIDLAPVPGRPKEWLGVSSLNDRKPSGLVRSADGGHTWEEVGEGDRLRSIRTLEFHPETGALLLGSYEEGVLESLDLGKTLRPLGKGFGTDNVCDIAVDPTRKERLYAGTQSGIYRSVDGGESWNWASKGLTALQTTGIHVLPGDRVLLLEYQMGAMISEDGGRKWPTFAPGWKGKYGKPYRSFAGGNVVAANTAGGNAGAALSRDGGRTWVRAELTENQALIGMTGPGAFFATDREGSILRSRDGVRFEMLAGRPKGLSGLPLDIVRLGVDRLGNDRFVVFTDTQSASFDPDTGKVGPPSALPEGLAWRVLVVDPGDPAMLWFSRAGSLHRKRFPRGKWELIVERADAILDGLVADPGRSDRRVALFSDGALLVSEDEGADWKPLEEKRRFRMTRGMAVTSDRRLLAVADGAVWSLDLRQLD